ncbi:tyrosine-type recombinase/integrase [Yinghuangia seranimata]|uniref:tyrosine-type recombinase/integrase n=1 Tax=Yinghuangia seranimata TaxID=408067 RepID=UPI00248CB608|nr:site-specific integrase [Yinghuangia seranimata]MDI2126953.1 site-specific integrase [Yinghuangia seranimata]
MPKPSFDVRIWEIRVRKGKTGRTSAEVRWKVAGTAFSETFRTKTLADGRRAELLRALHGGEPFDAVTGLPMSEIRIRDDVAWYVHAREYIEMKWPTAPAKTRTTLADALATATPVLVKDRRGMPDKALLRRALYGWAFNVNRWEEEPPEDIANALTWVEAHSLPMSALDDAPIIRKALTAFTLRLDGTDASASTVRRKRAIFHNSLGYAVEMSRLKSNPLHAVQWKAPDTATEVEPAAVVNPRQARVLLDAVRAQSKRGEHLEAFFGCLYYGAMRPAEAVWLRVENCYLPKHGWGVLRLDGSRPRVGSAWTDNRKAHDVRALKWRAKKVTRPVPIPPGMVAMLRWHVYRYGVAPDGRLFRTARGGIVQESGYGEVWAKARAAALTPQQVASPLGARPYDLRHAGVSLWLNSGVDPAEVAKRAGHSIAVLLKVYAKCMDGGTDAANKRITDAFGEWE